MGSFEDKLCRFTGSIIVLFFMTSIVPELAGHVSINAILGYLLGVIYVKDSYGRYHYSLDGRYVSSEERLCLECILPIIGILIPASITFASLAIHSINELLIVTFGAEIVGFIGGFGLSE